MAFQVRTRAATPIDPPDHGAPRRELRTDIQGLRAVAVGLVVLFHLGVPFLPGGYVGVDVFFVISGFLITSHLAREVTGTGRLRFGRFYARRIRRIIPVALVVAVATFAVALLVSSPLRLERIAADAASAALYVPNMWLALNGTSYLTDSNESPYQQYWSLGVEEQFYLIWPALLVGLFLLARRRSGRPWRLLGVGVTALVLVSLAASVWFTPTRQAWAFFSLPTRAWEFGVGALLALLLLARAAGDQRWSVPAPVRATAGWLGLLVLVGVALVYDAQTTFPGSAAVLPVAATALVIAAGSFGPVTGGGGVLLDRAPMQFVGRISYSVYLWHWPVIVFATELWGPPGLLSGTVMLAVTVLLSMASYRFVEEPFRSGFGAGSFRAGLPSRTVIVAALVTALVLAAGFVGLGKLASRGELDAGRPAATGEPTAPPVFTPYVPDNLVPSLRAASSDVPVLYGDGCVLDFVTTRIPDCTYGDPNGTSTIVLFGDSHAAQWFPAVERYALDRQATLVVFTRSACPAADVRMSSPNGAYPQCDAWRSAVLDRIDALDPALVVTSNYDSFGFLAGRRSADDLPTWRAGVQRTLERLPAGRTVMMADTPHFADAPSNCLAAHLDDTAACALPRAEALNGEIREASAAAAAAAGVPMVDLLDHLCTDTTCGPIAGNRLLYRDVHHLGAAMVDALAPVIEQRLDAARSTG
ncbi:acyltransferase [Nakamurella flava]|uniref:Acyltransferase n=1 Tax=Nakamurella flava TaxID=2576308 RepID=A0A4U6QMB6_9ACTN|nr:acyltransferase family protein [Nakamurella flava]TKV61551.1 acyltransferase [Nakamurella flava]